MLVYHFSQHNYTCKLFSHWHFLLNIRYIILVLLQITNWLINFVHIWYSRIFSQVKSITSGIRVLSRVGGTSMFCRNVFLGKRCVLASLNHEICHWAHKPKDLGKHACRKYKRWSCFLDSLVTPMGTHSSSSTLDRIVHGLPSSHPLRISEAP